MALATLAGVALCGCQAPAGPAAPTTAVQVALSRPATLIGALRIAVQHVERLKDAATNPYHLVGFHGAHLDEDGSTVAALGSEWTFTFSRYVGPAPAADLDVVAITVPGTGYTVVAPRVTQDAALSPIENWDSVLLDARPDSASLLAPLRAKGLPTDGATMKLERGMITIEAGGRSTTYDTRVGKFGAVK